MKILLFPFDRRSDLQLNVTFWQLKLITLSHDQIQSSSNFPMLLLPSLSKKKKKKRNLLIPFQFLGFMEPFLTLLPSFFFLSTFSHDSSSSFLAIRCPYFSELKWPGKGLRLADKKFDMVVHNFKFSKGLFYIAFKIQKSFNE